MILIEPMQTLLRAQPIWGVAWDMSPTLVTIKATKRRNFARVEPNPISGSRVIATGLTYEEAQALCALVNAGVNDG